MEKKKHISLRAIIAFALILGVLIPVLNGVVVPVSAAEGSSAPLELSSVIHVDGDGGSVLTSAIDAINLWRKSTSLGKAGRLAVKIPMNEKSLSDIKEFYVRMSNPHTDTTFSRDVDFCLVDHNNVMYGWRADSSDVTSGSKGYRAAVIKEGNPGIPGNCGTVEANTRNYWADKVYANAEYWYIHKVSEWQQRTNDTAGFATQPGQSFDRANVKYAVFQVPLSFENLNLNIGQIWGKKSDDTFKILFDPAEIDVKKITMFSTATNGSTSDYQLTKMRAGEVVVPASASANSAMRMEIPTNISQYNGVSFEVDLTDCASDLFMNKYVADYSDGNKEVWYSNDGLAMFYPEPGTKFYNEKGSSYSGELNVIPAGFKGTIVVAFCTFKPNPGTETKDNVMDLSKANDERLGFTIQPKGSYPFTGSFILKNVKLVSDAMVEYWVLQYLLRPDGRYNEAVMTKQTAIAGGPAYAPAQTVTNYQNTGKTCVLEKATLTGDGAYMDGSNFRPYKINDGGVASWGYRPRVYYRESSGYTIEKVFGLDNLPTTIATNEYSEAALKSKLPQGGITVGNSGGGLLQLEGSWKITKGSNSVTVKFTPTDMPTWLKDTNGVLTREIPLVQEKEEPTPTEKPGEGSNTPATEKPAPTEKPDSGTKEPEKTENTPTQTPTQSTQKPTQSTQNSTQSTQKPSGGTQTSKQEETKATENPTEATEVPEETETAPTEAEDTIPGRIEITTKPEKLNYAVGDTFDTKGLVVTLVYGNGDEEVLTEAEYTVSSPDMSVEGTQIVTVTSGKMTASFNITIAAESDGGSAVGVIIGVAAGVLAVAVVAVLVVLKRRMKS